MRANKYVLANEKKYEKLETICMKRMKDLPERQRWYDYDNDKEHKEELNEGISDKKMKKYENGAAIWRSITWERKHKKKAKENVAVT